MNRSSLVLCAALLGVAMREFNTDTAPCKAFIDARIQQKAGTCTGDLCV